MTTKTPETAAFTHPSLI